MLGCGDDTSAEKENTLVSAAETTPVQDLIPKQPSPAGAGYELPELRDAWRELGMARRSQTGVLGVLAELPRLLGQAAAISWRADRTRTLIVAGATVAGGVMSTFGLLSTQRLLVQLFGGGPSAERVKAALPALLLLGAAVAMRGGLRIAVGYAQNGLSPKVNQAG